MVNSISVWIDCIFFGRGLNCTHRVQSTVSSSIQITFSLQNHSCRSSVQCLSVVCRTVEEGEWSVQKGEEKKRKRNEKEGIFRDRLLCLRLDRSKVPVRGHHLQLKKVTSKMNLDNRFPFFSHLCPRSIIQRQSILASPTVALERFIFRLCY